MVKIFFYLSLCIIISLFFSSKLSATSISGENLQSHQVVLEKTTSNTTVSNEVDKNREVQEKNSSKHEIKKLDNKSDSPKEVENPNAGKKLLAEVLLLLVIIYFGIKFGGVALGLLGGLGITILVFVFGEIPGNPPVSVMLIICAVVTTSASLDAIGALDIIVKFVEKLLKNNPKYITILAPLSSFFLTVLIGTGHASYSLYPIIYDVAYKNKIRPERPMGTAAIASQMGITASPIAAAAAAVIACMSDVGVNISLFDIIKVTLPACFTGVFLSAIYSLNRGKDLMKDPAFLEKLKNPETKKYMEVSSKEEDKSYNFKKARTALLIFFIGVLSIVLIGIFSNEILPIDPKTNKPIKLDTVLQFFMLGVGAVIILVTKVSPKKIASSNIFNAGMVAVIMIFGIAWVSDTVIHNNEVYILSIIKELVHEYPWSFALAMFVVSAFLKSQAVVISVMFPIGLSIGLPVGILMGCIPASYAYFFFCFYPTDLAAINFDRSGTTKVGSYILNHSMMLPGLIGTITATLVAYFLSNFVYSF